MNDLTIVMYHYVRDLERTRYPEIKGRTTTDFRKQVAYLTRNYHPVTVQDLIAALFHGESLPPNAMLLTFDDGYIDHFANVFPVLHDKGVQGLFFPPVASARRRELLSINRIHFLLASVDISDLARQMEAGMDRFSEQYGLESITEYRKRWAHPGRFDDATTMYVKRMLQIGLPEAVRGKLCRELFRRFVTADEATFVEELYCTEEQLRLMQACGMYIGCHGDNHTRLDTLEPIELDRQIESSLEFLRMIGSPVENFWVMSYPHGAHNTKVVEALREKGCSFAVTIESAHADLSTCDPLRLPRFDTNEIPLG